MISSRSDKIKIIAPIGAPKLEIKTPDFKDPLVPNWRYDSTREPENKLTPLTDKLFGICLSNDETNEEFIYIYNRETQQSSTLTKCTDPIGKDKILKFEAAELFSLSNTHFISISKNWIITWDATDPSNIKSMNPFQIESYEKHGCTIKKFPDSHYLLISCPWATSICIVDLKNQKQAMVQVPVPMAHYSFLNTHQIAMISKHKTFSNTFEDVVILEFDLSNLFASPLLKQTIGIDGIIDIHTHPSGKFWATSGEIQGFLRSNEYNFTRGFTLWQVENLETGQFSIRPIKQFKACRLVDISPDGCFYFMNTSEGLHSRLCTLDPVTQTTVDLDLMLSNKSMHYALNPRNYFGARYSYITFIPDGSLAYFEPEKGTGSRTMGGESLSHGYVMRLYDTPAPASQYPTELIQAIAKHTSKDVAGIVASYHSFFTSPKKLEKIERLSMSIELNNSFTQLRWGIHCLLKEAKKDVTNENKELSTSVNALDYFRKIMKDDGTINYNKCIPEILKLFSGMRADVKAFFEKVLTEHKPLEYKSQALHKH